MLSSASRRPHSWRRAGWNRSPLAPLGPPPSGPPAGWRQRAPSPRWREKATTGTPVSTPLWRAATKTTGNSRPLAECTVMIFTALDESSGGASGSRGFSWRTSASSATNSSSDMRDAASRMSLDEFVAELALVRQENPREPDAPPEDSSNAVKIMTVHSAKGLEFPVVFVAALHKGVDTGVPVVAFSRHHGLGARWRNPAGGPDGGGPSGAKDDLFQHALRQEWGLREAEESIRLLYVAMKR